MTTPNKNKNVSAVFMHHLEEFDRAMAELQKARAQMFGVAADKAELQHVLTMKKRILYMYRVINPGSVE